MSEFVKILKKEIDLFDLKFKSVVSNKATLLHKVVTYLKMQSGKKIRPLCVILSAGLSGDLQDKTYRGAVLVELLHTATLIHDDIVDDAHIRRRQLSINAIWNNKISVLTGDYFLAKGLKLSVENKDYELLYLISDVVQKIVEGELLQIEKTKTLNLTEEDYFKIIKLKTAVLFESAFKIGAISVGAEEKIIKKMGVLGLKIGLLFQMKDDVLDYTFDSKITGKKSGNDIKEGKINLPLLHVLSKMSTCEKGKTYQILRKKINTDDEIKWVKKLVFKYRGIEYADSIIKTYHSDITKSIDLFEENTYKIGLTSLLKFLINRVK